MPIGNLTIRLIATGGPTHTSNLSNKAINLHVQYVTLFRLFPHCISCCLESIHTQKGESIHEVCLHSRPVVRRQMLQGTEESLDGHLRRGQSGYQYEGVSDLLKFERLRISQQSFPNG